MSFRTHLSRVSSGAVLAGLVAVGAAAAVPPTLQLDGKLRPENLDTGGGSDRTANLRITLVDAGGSALFSEDRCGVDTVGRDAAFGLVLGQGAPVDVAFDGPIVARVQACFDRDGCDGVVDPDACSERDHAEVEIPLAPVVYAHEAGNAETVGGLDADTLLQELDFAHPELSLSDANTVDLGSLANSALVYDDASRSLSVTDGSGSQVTDLSPLAQTLSRSGLDVSLSNGGGTVSVADDDNDSANELQALSRSGLNVTLSGGGGTVSVADDDNSSTNELQNLSVSGSNLSISGGNTVSLPGDNLGNHVAGTHLNLSGFDVFNARYGAFGNAGRFSNHGFSSRIGASNGAVDTAVFGSNEGTSGWEVGVYGRTESSGGYGVYSEGNFGVSGRTRLFDVPATNENWVLTLNPDGEVRRHQRARSFTESTQRVNASPGGWGYRTTGFTCPSGYTVQAQGAFDHGDPDVNCVIQSSAPTSADGELTRAVCGPEIRELEPAGEDFTWSIVCAVE